MEKLKNIKGNIYKMYAYIFFHNLVFAYVIERLFWEQRGMSIKDVVYTEIIYAVTIVFFEIPTGVLADKFKRKYMLIAAGFLRVIGAFFFIFVSEFWHFAVLIFLSGISSALYSGTTNSILYESLKEVKQEQDFEKVLGKMKMFDYVGVFIGMICGGFFAKIHPLVFNYKISFVSTLIAFLITLTLKEPKREAINEEAEQEEGMLKEIKKSAEFIKQNKSITALLLLGVFMAGTINYIDEFWQIFARDVGFKVEYFGLFGSASAVILSLGGAFAWRLKKIFKEKVYIYMVILYAISIIIFSNMTDYKAMFMILITYTAFSSIEVLMRGELHHRVSSDYRATIESVQSLAERLITIVIGIGFSLISDKFGVSKGFEFIGFVVLIYVVYFIYKERNIKVQNNIA